MQCSAGKFKTIQDTAEDLQSMENIAEHCAHAKDANEFQSIDRTLCLRRTVCRCTVLHVLQFGTWNHLDEILNPICLQLKLSIATTFFTQLFSSLIVRNMSDCHVKVATAPTQLQIKPCLVHIVHKSIWQNVSKEYLYFQMLIISSYL